MVELQTEADGNAEHSGKKLLGQVSMESSLEDKICPYPLHLLRLGRAASMIASSV
jgi:hypothetical protein